MCGIAGAYRAEFAVQAALESIRHRGPDHMEWEYLRDGVTHGHVRLAIMDPENERANQPLEYGDVTLSYVGECWNFRELRERLGREFGLDFRTDCDTEVVAAMLHAYGPAGLAAIEGMFAMAWTEEGAGTYLARDRFGKVPLYWEADGEEGSLFDGGGVLWASERRALPRPLEAAPVPAGHVIRLADRVPWVFYAPREHRGRVVLPGHSAPEALQELLRRSVRVRLQADVPVCCLCSGGLDSSLILALVKEVKPDVVAYTAVWNESSEDLNAAREMCEWLDVPLVEAGILPPSEERLRESIEAIEISMKVQVEIGTLCLPLAQAISEDGFKVCLTGEGADDLFGGYGNLARAATDDLSWSQRRRASVEKMARGDLVRTNKCFMAHGVEPRTPFLDRAVVEHALSMGVVECPPGKGALKDAARGVVPDWIIDRQKRTFQGGSGVSEAYEELTGGNRVRRYNEIAREVWGGIPRG